MDIGKRLLIEEEKPDAALIYYKEVTSRYKKNLPTTEKAHIITAYNNSGYILATYFNKLDEAYAQYNKGREICEANPEIKGKFALLGLNTSNLLLRYEELLQDSVYAEDARIILHHAFDDAVEFKKWELVNSIFINLSSFGFDRQNLENLKPVLSVFDTLPIPSETRLLQFSRNRAKAIHALENGKKDSALILFKNQGKFIDALVDRDRYKIQILSDLSECEKVFGNNEELLRYVLQIDSIAKSNHLVDIQLSSLRMLADHYRRIGNKSQAERYLILFYNLRDSLYPKGVPVLRNYPSISDEINRIDTLPDKSQLSHWSIIGIIFGLLFIVSGIVYFAHRKGKLKQGSKTKIKSYSKVTAEDEEAKYKSSPLQEDAKMRLAEKINKIFESNEEIYSPDFSLPRLAELCESRPSYISQIINEVMGVNFNTLLNSHRIKKACILIDQNEDQKYTIESIGYWSGFRSRSSFIAAFKKETGKTPSQYMKQKKS